MKKAQKNARIIIGVMTVCILSFGCSSNQIDEHAEPSDGTVPDVKLSHELKIERYSAGDTEYQGFYNNFEYKATILNGPVRDALLKRQAEYFQWDKDKTLSERDKSNQEAATETVLFLSFFTPDRHNDNLADSKTIWRIYLDAGGHRYQGKAKKEKRLLAELEALYPYHTRWNTPYMLSFPVPTNAIETQSSTLTITGPLGSRVVTFPATR
jgi:hypothetical protein